ncbi:hypothetical protein HMPREF9607_02526 [Cutibacterium modestum HL044PA1]|uniref:Uncharacterized protein n=1 Tax=Cutibacterium modestum HL044PA1 TaxID=765109 RepID=A0ABP2K5E0_9ACTN|nr:hypothetical protein HMPREF9607_02526 [Cutibacterium modestum HL044PA1]
MGRFAQGFVEDQDLGVGAERSHKRGALSHAVRQLRGVGRIGNGRARSSR